MKNDKKQEFQVFCEYLDLIDHPELKIYQEKKQQQITVIKFTREQIPLIEKRSFLGKSIICIELSEKENERILFVEEHTRGFDRFIEKIKENKSESTFFAIFSTSNRISSEFFVRATFWIIKDIICSKDLILGNKLKENDLLYLDKYNKMRNQKNYPYYYLKIKKILEEAGLKIENTKQAIPLETNERYCDFNETYCIPCGNGKYARIKMNEDLTFSILKSSILRTPLTSNELKSKVKSLIELDIIKYKKDEFSLFSHIKEDSPSEILCVLKEYKEKDLSDIVRLVIGKERLYKPFWEYIENWKELKERYDKLLENK